MILATLDCRETMVTLLVSNPHLLLGFASGRVNSVFVLYFPPS